jgi:hypothetical protein
MSERFRTSLSISEQRPHYTNFRTRMSLFLARGLRPQWRAFSRFQLRLVLTNSTYSRTVSSCNT